MILFENILRDMRLLMEDASVNDINDAISNMHPAEITYVNDNGNEKAEGKRLIYPVAYGISTAGNPVVRAFEEEGDTATKVPAWKLFLLSNIRSWNTKQEETFKGAELKGLAKNGKDKQIQTLYNVSPLSKSAISWKNDEPEIGSMPISKKEVEISGELSGEEVVDRTINGAERPRSLDNSNKRSYNDMNDAGKAMNAEPETKPVVQGDIPQQPADTAPKDNEIEYPSNDPISKEDIEGTENNEEPRNITDTYNDMMDRWEEKEEEN